MAWNDATEGRNGKPTGERDVQDGAPGDGVSERLVAQLQAGGVQEAANSQQDSTTGGRWSEQHISLSCRQVQLTGMQAGSESQLAANANCQNINVTPELCNSQVLCNPHLHVGHVGSGGGQVRTHSRARRAYRGTAGAANVRRSACCGYGSSPLRAAYCGGEPSVNLLQISRPARASLAQKWHSPSCIRIASSGPCKVQLQPTGDACVHRPLRPSQLGASIMPLTAQNTLVQMLPTGDVGVHRPLRLGEALHRLGRVQHDDGLCKQGCSNRATLIKDCNTGCMQSRLCPAR